ncbi:hydroxyethylthiazole kinase [Clostridium nigeriense]|uniref:hydroxyethylthiazole kinase n=1 Tax=Clostridium nigeriense TaxID=1805470 RepID=UPI003D341517
MEIKNKVMINNPLIHCITNHITINDCANVVLSAYGKPIMAEHYKEVSDITASSNALAINIGNITDDRMKSIMISAKTAYEKKIPSIIDIVGVSCSDLRLNFAIDFIDKCKPRVIKGNMSEIKAIFGLNTKSKGIDVNEEDITTYDTLKNNIYIVKELALKTNSTVVATGAIDIISDGNKTYTIENGCEELSRITGTGCMLNVLIATYISSKDIINSAILGTVIMGICGELSRDAKGTASFKIELLDNISTIKDEDILERIKIRVVE